MKKSCIREGCETVIDPKGTRRSARYICVECSTELYALEVQATELRSVGQWRVADLGEFLASPRKKVLT